MKTQRKSASKTVLAKGTLTIQKKEDFSLNIDTGRRLKKFDIDLSDYDLIFDLNPDIDNGKIYRHRGRQSLGGKPE